MALDNGTVMSGIVTAFETWGTLNADASNAVLLCHAWTGDSHASGRAGEGHPTPGWWESAVGPGLAIDTNQWFVVCANVLGAVKDQRAHHRRTQMTVCHTALVFRL